MKIKHKKTTAVLTAFGVVAVGGVAWAVISGIVATPNVVTGLVNGLGEQSCQTTGLTFTVPEPDYNATTGEYTVSTIGVSNVDLACVDDATVAVDLNLYDVTGQETIAFGGVSGASVTAFTITLSDPVRYDIATQASYRYLVTSTPN
jgi:hypothetical protein